MTDFEDDPWAEVAGDWHRDTGPRMYARAAYDSLVALLHEHDLLLDGAVVCDFGCGTGLLIEQLVDPVGRIDAVDTSAAMLAELEANIDRFGWTTVHPSDQIPQRTGLHDLVVSSSVLGFVDDHPATVRRLSSLLRPGGILVHWDWERLTGGDDDDDHGLSRSEVRSALEAAGLVDVVVDTAFELEVDGQTMRPLIGAGARPG